MVSASFIQPVDATPKIPITNLEMVKCLLLKKEEKLRHLGEISEMCNAVFDHTCDPSMIYGENGKDLIPVDMASSNLVETINLLHLHS